MTGIGSEYSTRMMVRTHIGLNRSRNEDAVVAQDGAGLAVLADGMGGLQAGDVASLEAVTTITRVLLRRTARHPEVLARAIRRADRRIHALSLEPGGPLSMGTTVVVWQRCSDQRALIAHVGDSRCYREHAGELRLLTRDHSVVQMQVDAGLLSEAQAWRAPNRHLITQALGLGEPISVEVIESPLLAGDRFLLCSDGLTDMISPDLLAGRFDQFEDDAALADTLLDDALAAGGRDNISFVLIRI
jgi:protein phosphatase